MEEEKKTILEYLETIPSDSKIKVGSENGNSYWYCGTMIDFLTKIDKYNTILYRSQMNLQKTAHDNEAAWLAKAPTLEQWAKGQLKTKTNPDAKTALTLDGWNETLKAWMRQVEVSHDTALRADAHLKAFIPLEDRLVVDASDCEKIIEQPGTKRIVVQGYENGSFWTMDEAPKLPCIAPKGDPEEEMRK